MSPYCLTVLLTATLVAAVQNGVVDERSEVPSLNSILPANAAAQEKFKLSAPDEIVQSGLLLKHLVVRSKISDPCAWTDSHLSCAGAVCHRLRRDYFLNGIGR